MKKFMPVLLAVFGLAGGLVGGSMLKPAAAPATAEELAEVKSDHGAKEHGGKKEGSQAKKSDDYVYVGLEKPFFVPLIRSGGKSSLARLDIHLEVPTKMTELVAQHDPKLRDAFLSAVMNFANDGGFVRVNDGEGFAILRDDLLVSARRVLGSDVKRVLIGEILTREG